MLMDEIKNGLVNNSQARFFIDMDKVKSMVTLFSLLIDIEHS